MTRCRVLAYLVVLVFGLGVVVGCGKKPGGDVKTAKVTGKVTLDGAPLADCIVHFNLSPQWPGAGTTKADGSYELFAEPGENRVFFQEAAKQVVADPAGPDSTVENVDAAAGVSAPKKAVAAKIPGKYTSADTSGVTCNVPPEGRSDADFTLTSK